MFKRSTVAGVLGGIALAIFLQLVSYSALATTCGGSGEPACPQLDGYAFGYMCPQLGYPSGQPCPVAQWSQQLANEANNVRCMYAPSSSGDYSGAVLVSNFSALLGVILANAPPLSPIGTGYTGMSYDTNVAGDCAGWNGLGGNTQNIFLSYSCSDGSKVTNPSSCPLVACTDKGGKFIDYRDSYYGAEGVTPGAVDNALLLTIQGYYKAKTMCVQGCRATTQTAQCFLRSRNSTTDDVICDATAQYLNQACIGSDKVLQAGQTMNERGLIGNTSGETGIAGGGAGVSGSTSADGINLARIATNTERMVAGLNKPLQVFIQGAEPGSGTGGGSCGGPGQPACVTDAPKCGTADTPACAADIEGKGAADAGAALTPTLDGLKGEALNAMKAVEDALKPDMSGAPNFGGDGSRWKWGLSGFIGGGSTCSHTWMVTLPKMAPQAWTLDICDNGPYFRAFLFWAFGIYVAWSLWSTIYTADRRA